MAANARKVTEKHVGEGDFNEAFEYWTKAAELGDVGSHYELSVMCGEGEGVRIDKKKQLHHLEQAASGGHPQSWVL